MNDELLSLIQKHFGKTKRAGEDGVILKCPFHKGGHERRPSFGFSLDRGIGHCFTCGESGTLTQLLSLLGLTKEEIDAEVGHDLRQFLINNSTRRRLETRRREVNNDPFKAKTPLRDSILKHYTSICPNKLVKLGFSPEVLWNMEVGFDPINERIMYPIKDIYGNLAGFSGGREHDWQEPKYKVYQGARTDRDGKVYPSDYGVWFDEEYPDYGTFKNHDFLWNYDRVYNHLLYTKITDYLIVVEGFKACLWLIQHGYWNTVALMGSRMTELQKQLLCRLDGVTLVLFLDNDWAGKEGTKKVGFELYKRMVGIYVARYGEGHEGRQPSDLDGTELATSISTAKHFRQIRRR